jgi:serine/threonine protein kinase
MGVVYLARDAHLDRDVAIKMLPEHFASDPERLARFEREAKLLASLTHPNIAGIYGVERHEGHMFLVLEYVEGETLADRLDRGPLPVDEAIDVCMQVAAGLEAAHDAGVVHRDLKPANVRLTSSGVAKVLDFGLARADGASGVSSSTSQAPTMETPARTPTVPGAILGTAPYMSPEQARGRRVDKRTDIWSFGVLLYECLTGTSPFIGETATDSIGAILHKDVDLGRLPPGTPTPLRRLLVRCMERDRNERLRDMGDARIELRDARSGESRAGAPLSEGARRQAWLAPAIAALAAALVVSIASWQILKTPPETSTSMTRLLMTTDEPLLMSGLAARHVAISPDGSTIVYSAGEGGVTKLYLRRLDSYESRALPGTEDARSPFFSPDGDRIAFFSQGLVKWISLSGGTPTSLCPVPGLHMGGTWIDDDTIMFCSNVSPRPLVVSTSGTASRMVDVAGDESNVGRFRWPHTLPDGDHVLLSHQFELDGLEGPHIVVLSLKSGQLKRITRGTDATYVPSGHIIFGQGDSLLAAPFDVRGLKLTAAPRALGIDAVQADGFGVRNISFAQNGAAVYMRQISGQPGRLVSVDRTGQFEVLDESPGVYGTPRLSPDQTRVVYWSNQLVEGTRSDSSTNICIYNLQRKQTISLTIEKPNASYAIWSHDGNNVMYLQFHPNGFSFDSMSANGSGEPTTVFEQQHATLITSLAPDGESGVMYEVNPVTNRDIYLWTRGEDSRPLIATPANERAGAISPDGRWLAYISDQSGSEQVYVTSFPDARGRWLISGSGGVEPRWSPAGNELFYREGDRMMRVVLEPGDAFIASPPEPLFEGTFAFDPFGNANYDITSDGQHFLMVRGSTAQTTSLNVLLGLDGELRRMFAAD